MEEAILAIVVPPPIARGYHPPRMPAVPRRVATKETRRPKVTSTSPRTRLSLDERRAQLVALGVEAFSERPFDEVSIDDVAQSAGISKGLLYHYFPTKRDFYVATVREVSSRLLEETNTPLTVDARTRLLKGLNGYISFADSHAKVYASLMRGGIGNDAEVTRVVEETREALVDRLSTGLRRAPPRNKKRTPCCV